MNQYGASSILSQYYDSPDLLFYREKLDGVARRVKLRIRTYGLQFKPGSTTFLEIKLRTNDRVRAPNRRSRAACERWATWPPSRCTRAISTHPCEKLDPILPGCMIQS